jgi:hypothetical protein
MWCAPAAATQSGRSLHASMNVPLLWCCTAYGELHNQQLCFALLTVYSVILLFDIIRQRYSQLVLLLLLLLLC